MLYHFLPGDADSFVATLDAALTCKRLSRGRRPPTLPAVGATQGATLRGYLGLPQGRPCIGRVAVDLKKSQPIPYRFR